MEEKLQGEATGKKVAKDDHKRAKTATTKVSGTNRRQASANEPQKPQKNSTQSWPSKPSPQASVASPVRSPTHPNSTNSFF